MRSPNTQHRNDKHATRKQNLGRQHTVARAVQFDGIGLHSGAPVKLVLQPAEADSGIVFVRTDVAEGTGVVPAQYDLVVDTRLGTRLANRHGVTVSTIEHLMAALWACRIDNVRILLDGPEVPIVDGSSEPFITQIDAAGVQVQNAPRRAIEVLKPVTANIGDATITLLPYDGYAIDIDIEFPHPAIASQSAGYDFADITFRQMLSRARTFGFEQEVEYLRTIGLARGGSLENAIVIGKEGVLNSEGLRFDDEFVRHKALDVVGDLYLAGAPLLARIVASHPGHSVNNLILRTLFAEANAWKKVEAPVVDVEEAEYDLSAGGRISMGAAISGALHE